MKTTISIPDPLFRVAEREAARPGSLAEPLYSMAVASYLKTLRARNIKKALYAAYATEDSALDPAFARLQSEAHGREEW